MSEPDVPYVITDAHRQVAGQCVAKPQKPARGALSWVILIALAVALFLFLQTRHPAPRARPTARPTVATVATTIADAEFACGVGGVFVGIAGFFVSLRVARRFVKAAPLADRFAVTERGVRWTWPHRRTFEPWSRFDGRYEGDGVELLRRRADGQSTILPTAAMTETMRVALRDHLVLLGRSVG